MHRLLLVVTTLAIMPCAANAANAATAEPTEPIPSYQQALKAFQVEQAKSGGLKLTPQERQVMERATRDLAAAMPSPGLSVGDRAPDFTLPNAFGGKVQLSKLLREGPVVLTFYRGAWCPYCNLQLHGLKQTLPHIRQAGAQLVAVTPQEPDKSRKQVEEDGYPFEILSDLDDRVMKQYQLYFRVPPKLSNLYKQRLSLDLADYNGPGRYVLPVPATFVIDRSGVIRAAFADVDYRKRMEPADIVEALTNLNGRQ
jgi:peroxiredoxin